MTTVLLTGASGFLGRYITEQLHDEDLCTLGRSGVSDIRCDLTTAVPSLPARDVVVHAAGLAHVSVRSRQLAGDMWRVNTTGTANLLSALERRPPPRAFVLISTVAVYGRHFGQAISEIEPLSATDPYGASKVAAESLVSEWCRARGVTCAILRLPLVAGSNAPGNLRNMIRGIKHGYYFNIAGQSASKSVVHARDVAAIVLGAGSVGGVYNLTDGEHPTLKQLASLIARELGRPEPVTLPRTFVMGISRVGDLFGGRAPIDSAKLRILTTDLTFDDSRARGSIGWRPSPVLDIFRLELQR